MRAIFAGIVVLVLASAASACPTCSDSVETPVEPLAASGDVAGGFNGAIWVLLAAAGGGAALVGSVLFLGGRSE